MKLLGDDRFAAVGADAGRGTLEEDRILFVLRRRLDRVPESDVDLQIELRGSEQTLELDAEAVVLALVPDRFGADRGILEGEPVAGARHRADLLHDRDERPRIVCRVPGEIQVPGGPVQGLAPQCKEHRSLENEVFAVPRCSEAVQEALRRVALEREVEVLPALLRPREEARVDRCGDILAGLLHDAIDSRYGEITVWIRQTSATRAISSRVAVRELTACRSASRATSSPIFLR